MSKKEYCFEELKEDFENKGFILDESEEIVKKINSKKDRVKCHCGKHNIRRF